MSQVLYSTNQIDINLIPNHLSRIHLNLTTLDNWYCAVYSPSSLRLLHWLVSSKLNLNQTKHSQIYLVKIKLKNNFIFKISNQKSVTASFINNPI